MIKLSTLDFRIINIAALFLVGLLVSLHPRPVKADISGHWEGGFTRSGALQSVSLDFRQTDAGWIGTYNIPDLILYREPIRDIVLAGDTINFRVFWGGFTCILHEEIGEITGENLSWKPSVSIHLKRESDPYRMRIEAARFPSDSLMLTGDLLLPDGQPPFPAVVVIEGSSTEGRQLWTYRSMGDLLAHNGIAALIYDKRGVGQSDGNIDSATFDDLANDVVSAVKFLAERSDIDSEAIGLFGISQGGWLAPLAAQRVGVVSFAVCLAGPAVSIWQQELHRVEYGMRAGIYGENEPDVFGEAEIAAALAHTRLGFEVAQDPEKWDQWVTSVSDARESSWHKYVALDSVLEDLSYWLRYQYDPKEILQNTNIPILAIFGGGDNLVPPVENVPLWRGFLTDAGNDRARIVVFPEVGHDFFAGASLVGGEWKWPTGFWRWNRRAVGLADTVITWIHRRTFRQLSR